MDYLPHVFRAALPEVLFVEDLAAALGLSRTAVRRALRRGELGPYSRIGRRLAVRRESLLESLEQREVTPVPNPPRAQGGVDAE